MSQAKSPKWKQVEALLAANGAAFVPTDDVHTMQRWLSAWSIGNYGHGIMRTRTGEHGGQRGIFIWKSDA